MLKKTPEDGSDPANTPTTKPSRTPSGKIPAIVLGIIFWRRSIDQKDKNSGKLRAEIINIDSSNRIPMLTIKNVRETFKVI